MWTRNRSISQNSPTVEQVPPLSPPLHLTTRLVSSAAASAVTLVSSATVSMRGVLNIGEPQF